MVEENEKTNENNEKGKEDDPNTEDDTKNLSLYDKTERIVTRQEEANKKSEEILKRQETLHANQRLAGTGGGHVETKKVSPEEEKVNQAKEFFKDTALGDAINQVNATTIIRNTSI